MTLDTRKAGQWIITEGGNIPEYFIYRLLEGQVSIYKGGRKIRDIAIKAGQQSITLGITSCFSPNLRHMASVKADTDVKLERIYLEQIQGVLDHEVPVSIQPDIKTMVKAIVMGNEITSTVNKLSDLPKVNFQVPDDMSKETTEIVSEIKRLYELIMLDVERII